MIDLFLHCLDLLAVDCLCGWQTDKENTNAECINQDVTAAIREQYHYSLIVSVTAGFPALHQT